MDVLKWINGKWCKGTLKEKDKGDDTSLYGSKFH